MNGYVRLANLKADLKLTTTDNDAILIQLIEDVSRAIDNETGRQFFSSVETRYFDPDGGDSLELDRDLISITTLEADDAGELSYLYDFTASHYWLFPDDLPYNRIDINQLASGVPLTSFPAGRKRVRINGLWGYSNETELTGATAAVLTSGATSVVLSDGDLVSVGETIVIDSEQIYVSAIATDTATLVRGLNGTTAAAHLAAAPAYRRRYERPIERATAMQVTRFWRDQQTGYSGAVANSEYGGFQFGTLYPAIADMLRNYKRTWVFA